MSIGLLECECYLIRPADSSHELQRVIWDSGFNHMRETGADVEILFVFILIYHLYGIILKKTPLS